MANINVKFNNKDYLLSCDDGQEEDLINLTKFLDKKYSDLKNHLKKIEDDQKKNKKLQEQFNQDIDELGEETNSLVEEIEKWQI